MSLAGSMALTTTTTAGEQLELLARRLPRAIVKDHRAQRHRARLLLLLLAVRAAVAATTCTAVAPCLVPAL